MYLLTRDDGTELRVTGNLWESALELGFLYGWRPCGTEAPRTAGWRDGRALAGGAPWDRQDYFSHESQRVGRGDARALGEAILRALSRVPAQEEQALAREQVDPTRGPLPSQASAVAEGLSALQWKGVRRIAVFAERDGFTIASCAVEP